MHTLTWQKSSYSGDSSNCVEVARTWQKSSYSAETSNCLEVAGTWQGSSHSPDGSNCLELSPTPTTIHIRDSKTPSTPHLTFPHSAWAHFLTQVRQ